MSVCVFELDCETDNEGFPVRWADWSPQIAEEMAKIDDIELTAEQWEVIEFLRDYYREYKVAPAMRVLTRAIGKRMGIDKGNTRYLFELFPMGPAKQACRYAGLPRPSGHIEPSAHTIVRHHLGKSRNPSTRTVYTADSAG